MSLGMGRPRKPSGLRRLERLSVGIPAVGIDGIVSPAVLQRTGEIGLRMALGAGSGRQPDRMRHSLKPAVAGVGVVMALVALVAGYVPARRASRSGNSCHIIAQYNEYLSQQLFAKPSM